jgi:hypothetical protein
MNVEIGAEAAQFPEKEYINGIAIAVQQYAHVGRIPFLNAEMSDFLASGQSGTRMNKNADTGTSPVLKEGDPFQYRNALVPDLDTGCRNADAGGIDLDADAQLCDSASVQYRNFSLPVRLMEQ